MVRVCRRFGLRKRRHRFQKATSRKLTNHYKSYICNESLNIFEHTSRSNYHSILTPQNADPTAFPQHSCCPFLARVARGLIHLLTIILEAVLRVAQGIVQRFQFLSKGSFQARVCMSKKHMRLMIQIQYITNNKHWFHKKSSLIVGWHYAM